MTDPPAGPGASPHRLRTFGTLTLAGPNAAPVLGTHGHHRRRLALLAVLAAAGEKGWSRDQLLLFFWPDSSQTRARHSLDQLLYALRSSIGDGLFSGSDPVRLNPAVITSDIGAFTEAIEQGELERAVEQYQGSFLDGFHLDGAPEFERWVDEERARRTGIYADALHRLAQRAEAAQDHAMAVRWWRKLADVDPVSATGAAGLIRSLMNAGDHAAALQYAERYEALVAQELGTSVGPAVAALVAEVRADALTESVTIVKTPALAATDSTDPRLPNGKTARQRPPAPSAHRSSRYWQLGLTALVLGTAAWFVATMNRDRSTPGPGASIAVMPFRNVSRDPQDSVIVDGLTEDIMSALQKIQNLRVVPRQSAFSFRSADIKARAIGDSLNVTYLLEGSIQRQGTQMRIQVHLIDAPNDSTRWAGTYDRGYENVFATQAEIAAAVARELNLRLGAGPADKLHRGLTTNIAAYDLYLRGRSPVHLRSDSGPLQGLALLKQAVALDSNFAAAYANMPYMYFSLSGGDRTPDENREFKRLAYEAAQKALALDPDLPESHVALTVAHGIGQTNMLESEAAIRRALALGGAPRAREHLSRVLMWSGRHAEALVEATRAAEEDPLSPSAVADLGEVLCANRRYREGMAQLARVLTDPPLRRVHPYRGLCFAMQGMWREALSEFGAPRSGGPFSPLGGYALARSGAVAEARKLQSEAIELWQRDRSGALSVAFVAAGVGDYDTAFEWLNRAVDDLVIWSPIMYPLFEQLHKDPRFEQFRLRVGLQKR